MGGLRLEQLDQLLDVEHKISAIESRLIVLKADLLISEDEEEKNFLRSQIEENEEDLYFLKQSTVDKKNRRFVRKKR